MTEGLGTAVSDQWAPIAECVRVEVDFTLEELHQARRWWYRQRLYGRTRVPPTFLAASACAAAALTFDSRVALVLAVLMLIVYAWQAYQRSWTWLVHLYHRDPELLSPFAIEFSPEGVLVRRGGQQMWVGWGRIEEILEAPDGFLVCDTPAPLERFVLVPRRAFATDADQERVRDLARTYCRFEAP